MQEKSGHKTQAAFEYQVLRAFQRADALCIVRGWLRSEPKVTSQEFRSSSFFRLLAKLRRPKKWFALHEMSFELNYESGLGSSGHSRASLLAVWQLKMTAPPSPPPVDFVPLLSSK